MRLSHHPAAQRLGRALGHQGKRLFGRLLDWVVPVPENLGLAAVGGVRRVLLVRPNFRIGNTLITSPLVAAVRERFPEARLDYLAGDTTASLLAHLPIDAVYCVSRRFIARPWRLVALFARLRRNRYDVAIEAGLGSFSGGLYAFLAGARFRVGCEGSGDRFLNVRLPRFSVDHVYDSPARFAALIGATCADRPLYRVGAEEAAAALGRLREIGLADGDHVRPFVALFVGGHQDKRWPLDAWLEVTGALAAAGGRVALFLGPEESQFERRVRAMVPAAVAVVPPQPLRIFAALWARAGLIVTPDSGPMHLAAALAVPTVALLQARASLRYRPRGALDRVLVQPRVAEVVETVLAHPAWAAAHAGA